jgi:DivIVA domain-containing protein
MGETLSAKDITRSDFTVSRRGYDRDEVDSFLRTVADEHSRLLDELSSSQRNADKPYKSFGADVGELLQHAKDSADRLRRTAEEEADRRLRDAKNAATETRERAEHDAQQIRGSAERDASERIKEAEERVALLTEAETEARDMLRDIRAEIAAVLGRLEQVETSLGGASIEGPGEAPESGAEAPEVVETTKPAADAAATTGHEASATPDRETSPAA